MGWGWLFGKKKKNSKSGSKALAERTYLQDDVSSRNLQDEIFLKTANDHLMTIYYFFV